jgi:transmembrane sensor
MNAPTTTTEDPIPPERVAEAGVWIARLHDDERSPALEAGFRQWLQADPLNVRAFEPATEVWEDAASLRRIIPFTPTPPVKNNRPWHQTIARSVAATVLVGVFLSSYPRSDGVATGLGEQRMLTLDDGTRVYFNTATHVVVRYDKRARRVELKMGEALFEVAKRSDWPFIVTAGSEQVRALGTSFVVRRDDHELVVTLVEGKVTISPVSVSLVTENLGLGEAATLAPGQRLTLAMGKAAQFDTPSLDKAHFYWFGRLPRAKNRRLAVRADVLRLHLRKVFCKPTNFTNQHISHVARTLDIMIFAPVCNELGGHVLT